MTTFSEASYPDPETAWPVPPQRHWIGIQKEMYWDLCYELLAVEALADEFGGAECRRLRSQWEAEGKPLDCLTWLLAALRRSAQSPPT